MVINRQNGNKIRTNGVTVSLLKDGVVVDACGTLDVSGDSEGELLTN